jgi:hypothetical protein
MRTNDCNQGRYESVRRRRAEDIVALSRRGVERLHAQHESISQRNVLCNSRVVRSPDRQDDRTLAWLWTRRMNVGRLVATLRLWAARPRATRRQARSFPSLAMGIAVGASIGVVNKNVPRASAQHVATGRSRPVGASPDANGGPR